MPKTHNLIGNKYGRLTVIAQSETIKRRTRWKCECECGNLAIVPAASLKSGHSKSCGCLQRQKTSNIFTTHGLSRSSTYRSYRHAKNRCYNPNDAKYQNYGARGIYMCDAWKNSFQAFLDDMGERPEKMSLERKDVNGPYSPENCCWETSRNQSRNKTNNHFVEFCGEMITITDFAAKMGLSLSSIKNRMKRNGEDHLTAAMNVKPRSSP